MNKNEKFVITINRELGSGPAPRATTPATTSSSSLPTAKLRSRWPTSSCSTSHNIN